MQKSKKQKDGSKMKKKSLNSQSPRMRRQDQLKKKVESELVHNY